ncbi:hypothetical protein Pla175_09270 [Pirellulimonas nuda]|uniref:DUF420 domain-containing protein n=1 Tax=Pirellulimonas nuda TaxID=2528009 RepID=A0A518D7V1_9BACT|nr:DUF420 domain-containing protein [Pirellulimonas nuda]QDU87562.1 hypothetical protein Pla175_09270 [Pirellulimonas nuda]
MLLAAVAAHPIVHLNASLNAAAAVLLMVGWVLIRQRKEQAHKWVMISATVVSSVFLACYLYYHYNVGSVAYDGPVRPVYFAILISHVVLAVAVPPLALTTIYLGLRALAGSEASPRYRAKHRRLARWTFPVWMYVSVTGVIVYVMLYHL